MKHEIRGTPFPVVTCSLENGESMITQKGGMAWMTDKIQMVTDTKGGFMKGLGRMVTGESMFLNTYIAQDENQSITFGSSYAGRILEFNLDGSMEIIAQKGAFLAMEPGVTLSTHFNKKVGVGIFGGEGFIMQKFTGNGHVFLEIDGELIEHELKEGETIKIDQGYLAAMENTVTFDITTVKGVKNVLFGGEGLFLATVTGPGKVWIQTMPLANIVNLVLSYAPMRR
jgi:uncharacterized protein (TIGR00266 family)